jgi:hypothetical protein
MHIKQNHTIHHTIFLHEMRVPEMRIGSFMYSNLAHLAATAFAMQSSNALQTITVGAGPSVSITSIR